MDKDFSGKKIAILGFGLEGQDLCRFFLEKKAEITVFDQKRASELGKEYFEFKNQGVGFGLGKNYLKSGIKNFDIIFRSPGFRRFLPEILEAEKAGVKISSATKLFFELCQAKIVGVTGTKGKGTTSTLIYQILKRAKEEAFLAGNIGQPMLALLPKLTGSSWVVLELSSFQLQDLNKSPHIAVVLFVTSEHLDYHQSRKEYILAKENIVCHQEKGGFAILNADNATSSSFASLTPAQTFFFSRKTKVEGAYVKDEKIFLFGQLVGSTKGLQLRGRHNWDNVCAAATAAWVAGAKTETIKKAVFAFRGLEHRLELVKKTRDVAFYNDSFSTTPETAIAAIRSFKEPVILIAGGSEKGSSYRGLGKEIVKSSVKVLILIGQTADRIKKAAIQADFRGEVIYKPGKMREIVKVAFQKAGPGDIVLLSPACASFDMFANYKDRGVQFKREVKRL